MRMHGRNMTGHKTDATKPSDPRSAACTAAVPLAIAPCPGGPREAFGRTERRFYHWKSVVYTVLPVPPIIGTTVHRDHQSCESGPVRWGKSTPPRDHAPDGISVGGVASLPLGPRPRPSSSRRPPAAA